MSNDLLQAISNDDDDKSEGTSSNEDEGDDVDKWLHESKKLDPNQVDELFKAAEAQEQERLH